MISNSCPVFVFPDRTVPVTTDPKPVFEKTRSTAKWKNPRSKFVFMALDWVVISDFSASIPSPVSTDVRMMGASFKNVLEIKSRISNSTRSIQSVSSAKSVLVSAIIPCLTPSSLSIWRCSRVWGMMPSSTAMTIRAIWMVETPATILRMNLSCPGTSIIVIFLSR